MKLMSDESLRLDLAHQLLLILQNKKNKLKKNFKDDAEDIDRTEKYLKYVLKFCSKD